MGVNAPGTSRAGFSAEKGQELCRGVDGKLRTKSEKMAIAGHDHRTGAPAKRDEVVVSRVGGHRRGRDVWVIANFSVPTEEFDQFGHILAVDPTAELRISQCPPELCEQRLRDDQVEGALDPQTQDPGR